MKNMKKGEEKEEASKGKYPGDGSIFFKKCHKKSCSISGQKSKKIFFLKKTSRNSEPWTPKVALRPFERLFCGE